MESSDVQQSAELRRLKRKSRIAVCAKAGVQHRTFLTKRVSLAMKANLHLTWNQLRKQKRFLRSVSVQFQSEKSEREVQKDILQDNLVGKMVPLKVKNEKAPDSIGGFVTRDCPLVQVSNLVKFVEQRLNEYDENNWLVYGHNNIPTSEIWIKIGGDHGGSSFKISIQVLNLERPNSRENTNVR